MSQPRCGDGMVKCPTHGHVIGMFQVCAHISQQIDAGSLGPHRHVRHLLLCDACMDSRLAPFEAPSAPDFIFRDPSDPACDAARQAYDEMHERLDGACPQCTAAAQVRHARAVGQPAPWPAFERTLTGSEVDSACVENLTRVVETFRDWRPSIVDPRRRAVSVMPGAFTYPLTVTAYYVTDPGEQLALVKLVERFLAGRAQDQALVRFLGAENWQPSGTGGFARGPENVLAEYYLNCAKQAPDQAHGCP